MNSHERDLDGLTNIIGEKIGEIAQKTESLLSSAFIYRVPGELRKLKESVYTPRLIAIGPLHRYDKHLQTPIQHVKFSYTNNLFCRLTKGIEDPISAMVKKRQVLKECVEKMAMLIDDAKKCYAEEVALDEEMLLVDGCFILELLYGYNYQQEFGAEQGVIRQILQFLLSKEDGGRPEMASSFTDKGKGIAGASSSRPRGPE